MKNEVIELLRSSSVPSGFPVCTELTPSNVGNMSARILAVMTADQSRSSGDIRGLIADRFGKRYDNLEDFGAKLQFLVGTGHVQEIDHLFMLTEKGASLVSWIESARPQMFERSHSANEGDRAH